MSSSAQETAPSSFTVICPSVAFGWIYVTASPLNNAERRLRSWPDSPPTVKPNASLVTWFRCCWEFCLDVLVQLLGCQIVTIPESLTEPLKLCSQVVSCFGLAVTSRLYLGFAVVSLLVEINSVFLHIRQLLLLSGRRNKPGPEAAALSPSVTYHMTSWLNMGT